MSAIPAIPSPITNVDPVTFEVIRHRLWAINDEQGTVGARLSGSPIVYEAYDFNSGLLTAEGEGVFTGIYIVAHAAPLHIFVSSIREHWAPEDIHEGDMFFTNDPWAGALHANDGILAAPLFHDGRVIAWSGIVMHDMDVGGPVPGSFVVGATDRFGEAPLMPPVKMVDRYELRDEITRAYIRNHRTPEMTLLSLRARMAALTTTQRRVRELVAEYGVETVLATQSGIIDYVERVVRARLLDIPDGQWSEQVYIDHDGVNDELYPVRMTLIKRGDRLIADFAGTSPQAPGSINCARSGLEGGLFGIFLLFLCFDLPWSVGAARRIVEIRSEPGSLIDAEGDAAVSLASVMGTSAALEVAHGAFAKMLLCSTDPALRSETHAPWGPTLNSIVLAGLDGHGEPFAHPMLEVMGGGSGARTFADGIDTGGSVQSLSGSVGNVEVTEERFPLLQLYRRERRDSGGAGRLRGGVGLEQAVIPHKVPGPLVDMALGRGRNQPEGHGLSGGNPGSISPSFILRGSSVHAAFAAGRMPTAPEELEFSELEAMPAKAMTMLGLDDVHVVLAGGGGGYGDPVRRDPERVLADVRSGHVSTQAAETVYGVALQGGAVDVAATTARRQAIRDRRLSDSSPAGEIHQGRLEDVEVLHPAGDTVEVVGLNGGERLRCCECHRDLGPADRDLKLGTLRRDVPISEVSELNVYGWVDRVVLRQFSCPGCGTAIAVDVQLADDPILPELSFTAPTSAA
jgi:N-methylhydantoinase B